MKPSLYFGISSSAACGRLATVTSGKHSDLSIVTPATNTTIPAVSQQLFAGWRLGIFAALYLTCFRRKPASEGKFYFIEPFGMSTVM